MKAVVLAGGEGTRLKPLTYKRPKPLIPVAGRPCIDYVLRSLAASGFHEIIVTTAYLSDTLIKSIGDGLDYNASIVYSFEENPAGTAGAVRRVGMFIDDTFLVAMGDILCDVDFKALYDFHKRKGGVVTIALTDVEDPTQFGIVGLDSKGRIQKFKEKPRKEEAFSNLANAGIYVLEPEVLEFIPTDQKFDVSKDLFPKRIPDRWRVDGHRASARPLEGEHGDRPAGGETAPPRGREERGTRNPRSGRAHRRRGHDPWSLLRRGKCRPPIRERDGQRLPLRIRAGRGERGRSQQHRPGGQRDRSRRGDR